VHCGPGFAWNGLLRVKEASQTLPGRRALEEP
jgi:hypothetical protein